MVCRRFPLGCAPVCLGFTYESHESHKEIDMRISVKKSILFVIVALIVLLVVGSAVAAPLSQHGINGEPEPEAEVPKDA